MVTKLTGRVIYPGDPGWDEARKNFNQRFDVQPHAVVCCQNVPDVVNAIRWARENKVPLRARSGRHSYEGYSLVNGGLIIDVGDIDHVRVDRDAGIAEIGAGIYMLECSEMLAEVGVTTPLATGPTVGLAGLALGGGFGLTSRKFGLICDNVLEIEIVTASGEVLRANADPRAASHPDLFWACRGGGGGNFGIATQFSLRVHPVSVVLGFIVQWNWDQFDQVVAQWQRWAPIADDGLSAALQLTVGKTIKLYGMYTPDDPSTVAKGADLLAPLLSAVPPAAPPTIQPLPFVVAARMFFGEGGHTVDPTQPQWAVHVHSNQQIYKSTSAAVMKSLPAEAIAMLRGFLEAPPPLAQTPVQVSMVQLLPGGGAPSRVAANATAVYLRNAAFIIQYDGYWVTPQDAEPTVSWVERMRNAMQPYTQGAYVNYVDSRLPDPLRAYYGPNLERLVHVKQEYDPDNIFNSPQSIPLKLL
jgi:FAD/FMN-containing dehydrogenase